MSAASAAEIADNKWELESTKPPVKSASAYGQIALMVGLALFFAYVVIFSVIAIIMPAQEGTLADQYKNLSAQPAAAPTEAATP